MIVEQSGCDPHFLLKDRQAGRDMEQVNLRTNSSVVESKLSRKFHVPHSGFKKAEM